MCVNRGCLNLLCWIFHPFSLFSDATLGHCNEVQPPLWKRRCARWRRPLVMSILQGGAKSQAVAPLPRDVGNGVDKVAKISFGNCIAVGPLHGRCIPCTPLLRADLQFLRYRLS